MGWVGPQATSHIYFFIDTIFIMGYCRNRAVIGDIAVIGKCKASLMGPPNAGRRDPGGNCILKMSRGDVTWSCQGYGFFLFFLGRVGPEPTSTGCMQKLQYSWGASRFKIYRVGGPEGHKHNL